MRENHDVIFRQMDIRLQRMRARLEGARERAQRVFGELGAIASMRDGLRVSTAQLVLPGYRQRSCHHQR